ncbi:MAG: asparagine synthase (glutamine-hydrolyzing) [Leptolyngbya sp. PLA1]|nr:asparagine synthase (glutamine-hydrolyzing) [Leptolyngbya sp. PLA1]
MCGIGAIVRITPADAPGAADTIPDAWLDALDQAVAYRGPDGAGRFRDRVLLPGGDALDVGIVHRRLAIIDLQGGTQPMRTPDGPGLLAVAFNGCVYNHRTLRAELIGMGHQFLSDHSDTEVLLHGWRAWGRGLPQHLNAMAAWLLWDRAQGRLIAGGDAHGEKPLFVWGDRFGPGRPWTGLWVFASTAEACRRVARLATGRQPAPERSGACATLSLGYGELTPGVTRLVGHGPWATPGAAAPEPRAEHGLESLAFDAHHHAHRLPGPASGADPAANVESLLRDAVRTRLDADVPLACLLSGGVDSSLIAWAASRERPDLRTLCVRLPGEDYDESPHAAEVARSLGTRHLTVDAAHAAEHAADDLVMLIDRLGSPFGDSSLLPTYWAFRAAAEHAKVVLTGDGGDELFLGYDRYNAVALARRLQPLRALVRVLSAVRPEGAPRSRRTRAARLCRAVAGEGYADLLRIFPSEEARLLIPEWPGGEPRWPESPTAARDAELSSHFVHDMLTKVDHASLCAGVEARAPMLDPRLWSYAHALPEHVLTPNGERKGLLRGVARRHLPASAIDRPKMGFAAPIGAWLRADTGGLRGLLTDALLGSDPLPASVLGVEVSLGRVRTLVDEHLSGSRDHAQRLYWLLVLAIWARSRRA